MKAKLLTFGVVGLVLAAGALLLLRSSVQLAAAAPGASWESADIGRVGQAGSAEVDAAGNWALSGSGADIWGAADGFHFVYLPWDGDVEIIARVLSVEKTDPWAKAGIMIRAELGESAPHAMVAMAPEKGPVFIRRLEAGGRSKDDAHQAMRLISRNDSALFQQRGTAGVDQAIGSLTALPTPRWIKLVRRGQVFTAYDSNDGVAWEWLGTETLELPPSCYIGLAVTSHDASRLCRTAFDRVSVGRPDPASEMMAPTGTGDGLRAAYYPGMDLSGPSARRIDPTVDFDWGLGSPAEGIGRNGFSVHWEAELEPRFTEPYAIHLISDDRAKLWLNGHLLIDEWAEHPETESTAIVELEAGKRYLLRVDHFEHRGRAMARLLWSSPSTPKQAIPSSQLYSETTDQDQDGLPDLWERTFGLNPDDPTDAGADVNGDGRSGLEEYWAGDDPTLRPVVDGGLPVPWVGRDVGVTGLPGTADTTRDGLTLQASGHDIWANADAFHFVYQLWRGDVEVVARVVSQKASDPWAKAGIMLRESLRAEAQHAMLAARPEHGVAFLQRSRTAAVTSQEAAEAEGPWLRLVRRGDRVSAFASGNGLNWQWVGTVAIAFSEEIYVGVAVSSHDDSQLSTAVFDQLSLRPTPAISGRPAEPGGGDGLVGTYFDSATGAHISRIDPTVDFDWDIGTPAEGIAPDHFSVRWEGWLEVPQDGLYALHVVSDDGARLWLDGKLLIDAWEDRAAVESTARVSFKAGYAYTLKLEYFDRGGEAIARLLWSTPTLAKEPVPQSQLHSAPPSGLIGGSSVASIATAAPEEEATSGLPSSKATAEEPPDAVASHGTPDVAITGVGTVVEVPGAAVVDQVGRWELDGEAIVAVGRRGTLEYEVQVPAADLYQWEIEAGSANPFDSDRGFYLGVWVDGEWLGRLLLDAGVNQSGKARVLGPWLAPGPHRIRLFWDNARKGRSLQVNAVRLQVLDGPDGDENGVKDWVEQKLERENAIESVALGAGLYREPAQGEEPTTWTSPISPACLEGRGGYLRSMTIRTSDREEIQPAHGVGERWFANVPLSAEEPTVVEVSFQNGGRVENARLLWEPTNLLLAQDTILRQGDVLLLTIEPGQPSNPQGASTERQAGTAQIKVGEVTAYAGPPSVPCSYRFEQAGRFQVTGVYTDPSGRVLEHSIDVRVLAASQPEGPLVWTGRERTWSWVGLPGAAVLEWNPRIRVEASVPGAEQREFRIGLQDAQDHWLLARAGESGSLLAGVVLHGLDILGVSESGAFYGQEYPDGSRLVETAVAVNRIFPEVEVRLEIIVGGVMFDDGTLVKTLRAEDFDETGLAEVHFLMPPGIETSNCHVMRAYQSEAYLGEY